MFDVIAIGDIKLDTFVVLDDASVSCQLKMPECQLCLDYGAKITVSIAASLIAGTAPNVAVGLSRMKLKTAVMSNMGTDGTYNLALSKLTEEGVSTKFIRGISSIPSAYSVVLNYKGERTVLASQTKRMYTFPKPFPKSKWIYVGEMGSTYEKMFRGLVSYLKKNPVQLAFNPGTVQIADHKKELFDLIAQTTVLFVNLQEAQAITGETSTEIHHLATALWKLKMKYVVITDGKNGSYSFDGHTLLHCPIYPGKLVGAIGAGDAFGTGFIAAIIKNSQKHPLVWGAVNSASVVGKIGPQEGLLSDIKILEHLRKKNIVLVKM